MVLSEVNVKSMAENWKSYLNLTQKYANELHNCINIERPLLHFTAELVKNLNNILEMVFLIIICKDGLSKFSVTECF